jgi:hypothetical protein
MSLTNLKYDLAIEREMNRRKRTNCHRLIVLESSKAVNLFDVVREVHVLLFKVFFRNLAFRKNKKKNKEKTAKMEEPK